MSGDEPCFRLLPSLNAAALGDGFFIYDERARTAPIVSVPTQRVPRQAYEIIRRLKEANPAGEAWPLERIKALFLHPGEASAVDVLVRRGYLEPSPVPGGTADRDLADTFASSDARHFFVPPRLFHIPRELADDAADVGFVGVPYASNPQSIGTAGGPHHLRTLSQRTAFWFDIHARGLYTEVGVDNDFPRVLCKDTVLQDFGDLGAGVRTVADLFAEIRHLVDGAVNRGMPLVFAGGDHAITFPIVAAYLRHLPELALIHLDAHNDLFFADRVTYDHGAVVSNLLLHSNLQRVYSFGLRTQLDPRVGNVNRFAADATLASRVHLRSLASLKRMLADRERFDDVLAEIGHERPCYLTIDLDVLTPGAMANQVSTPGGPGLEWWELFELVATMTERIRLVACDLVELNTAQRSQPEGTRAYPVVLLLLLVNALARGRRETGMRREQSAAAGAAPAVNPGGPRGG